MDTEKVAKWIRVCGAVFAAVCFTILIGFSFSKCSGKALGPGEDHHWSPPPAPTDQP